MEAGDIIMMDDGSGKPFHTAMYVGKNYMVHCSLSGVVREEYTTGMFGEWVFSYTKNKDIGSKAAFTARQFANTGQTSYGSSHKFSSDVKGMSREEAVAKVKHMKEKANIYREQVGAFKFNVDSLRRCFKWAYYSFFQIPFSVNRGTTCCAFVLGCYHAAAIRANFPSKKESLCQAYKQILDMKGPEKRPSITEAKKSGKWDAKAFKGYGSPTKYLNKAERWAYPFASNRGLYYNNKKLGWLAYDRVWADLIDCYAEKHEKTKFPRKCENVIPSGMLVDAKYIYTDTLYKLLSDDKWWEKTRVDK